MLNKKFNTQESLKQQEKGNFVINIAWSEKTEIFYSKEFEMTKKRIYLFKRTFRD